jgi:hypothetical protein
MVDQKSTISVRKGTVRGGLLKYNLKYYSQLKRFYHEEAEYRTLFCWRPDFKELLTGIFAKPDVEIYL